MIIHNNNLGLTVYTMHPKENYKELYLEYRVHEDERNFWSNTEKKVISSAWNYLITDKVYKRLYFLSKVVDLGEYSLVAKGLESPLNVDLLKMNIVTIGVVIGDMINLAREYIMSADNIVLYFDEPVARRKSKMIRLCFITKQPQAQVFF